MSMSSYSIVQLAAIEKQKIRENVNKSISIMCNSQNKEHVHDFISFDSVLEDDIVSGEYEKFDKAKIKLNSFENRGEDTKRVDLSKILDDMYSSSINKRVKEIISEVDELEYHSVQELDRLNSIVQWINDLISKDNIDEEDIIALIKDRIYAYKSTIKADLSQLSQKEVEYSVLCDKLGLTMKHVPIEQIDEEIEKLYNQAYMEEEQRYIKTCISYILENELGLSVENECVLNEFKGTLYNNKGLKACKVFASSDGEGLLLDAVVANDEYDREYVECEAEKVCEIKERIKQNALEKGIILSTEIEVEADFEKICKIDEIASINKIQKQTTRTKKNNNSMMKGAID